MGMYVDDVRPIDGVGRDRIVNEGLSWGMSGEESEGVVISTLRRIREALDDSRDMAGETNLVEHVRTRANELTDGL